MSLAPLRVLITGGAGFIGSHLAEALLARGDEVWVLDDLSTGRLDNLAAVAGHPRLHVQVGSVFDADLVPSLVDEVEIVYHLAASVGVRLILERPVETIENNILGTSAVLRAAVKGRRKVIIASSSEVYGKADHVPLREDDDSLLGPTVKSRWSYACSKAIDEFLALAYWHGKEVPVVVLRYFNTVGPRQTGRYGMVVPRLVGQALRGEPLTVYGDGRQTRSFTDVADAVRGTVLLADHPGAVGQVFNVGNGREVSILELAERIRALTGTASPITLVPYDEAYGRGFEGTCAAGSRRSPRRAPWSATSPRWTSTRPSAG